MHGVRHRVHRHAAVRRAEPGDQRLPRQRHLHRLGRRRSRRGVAARARRRAPISTATLRRATDIRRLLTCNNTTALQVAAAQVPEFTVVLVVVNSTIYGGSGGRCRHLLARRRRHRDRHPRDGSHRFRAGRRVCVLCRRQRNRSRSPSGRVSRPSPTSRPTPTANTLKWRWAVACGDGDPDDEQSGLRARWTLGPARCRPARSGCSKARTTTIAAASGRNTTARCAALGVPFCRVCRQVIWNRIGPLATLQARARTPITVVARYPEHLDVFAVANNGRTMSNWWDQSTAGRVGSTCRAASRRRAASGSPVTSIARIAGHLDLFTVGTDNRVYSCWWDVTSGWIRLVPHWQPAVSSRFHRQRRRAATPIISIYSPPRPTAASCRRGGTRAPAGRSGSR